MPHVTNLPVVLPDKIKCCILKAGALLRELFKILSPASEGSLPQYTEHYTLGPPFLEAKTCFCKLNIWAEFGVPFICVCFEVFTLSEPDWLKADNPPCDKNNQGGALVCTHQMPCN